MPNRRFRILAAFAFPFAYSVDGLSEPSITVEETSFHGRQCLEITTPWATLYFENEPGVSGFKGVVDNEGNDWLQRRPRGLLCLGGRSQTLWKRDWIYERTIELSKEDLAASSIYFNAESLDTFASIYINGRLLLESENILNGFLINPHTTNPAHASRCIFFRYAEGLSPKRFLNIFE